MTKTPQQGKINLIGEAMKGDYKAPGKALIWAVGWNHYSGRGISVYFKRGRQYSEVKL